MLKGTLASGATVEVTFSADFSNHGTSSLLSGYVPDPSADPPPGPQFASVAAGSTVTQTLNPLAKAFQLVITLDVPDAQGSGKLEVRENGVIRSSEPVQADTRWTYIVT